MLIVVRIDAKVLLTSDPSTSHGLDSNPLPPPPNVLHIVQDSFKDQCVMFNWVQIGMVADGVAAAPCGDHRGGGRLPVSA